MSYIKGQQQSLQTFFSLTYHIPEYQRGYSWKKDELENLWEDLKIQFENNVPDHFFGQIVIHQDTDKKFIIDGQQRITTIAIFCSVVRSTLIDLSEIQIDGKPNELSEDFRNSADYIRGYFLGMKSKGKGNYKLILGREGHDFFEKYVLEPKNSNKAISNKDCSNTTEQNIKDAIYFFRRKINEILEGITLQQKFDILDKYIDIVGNRLQISLIETDDQNQAFAIFETLNARGVSLATSDLLKNHILRTSSEDARKGIISKWETMTDNLEKTDPTKFIRSFWNSRFSFLRDKMLYKNLRLKYNNSGSVEELMNDLSRLSSSYKSLVDPQLNPFPDKTINNILNDLVSIGASTFYPLFLSMISEEVPNLADVAKVLVAVSNYYVRNIVVGNQSPTSTELFFADLAVSYNNKKVTADGVVKTISNAMISDVEFKNSFMKLESKVTKQTRYLLEKLEYCHGNNKVEKIINSESIHVEHIMPKSNQIWGFDEEVHDKFVNRLGNQTLLGPEYNIKASNEVFVTKKKIYEDSEILMTKDLLKYEQWNSDTIDSRQRQFAEYAVDIWKL